MGFCNMSQPNIVVDAKGALVDALSRMDPKGFSLSLLHLKNSKGVKGILEMERLEAELMDFAKDPSLSKDQLPPRPRMPDTAKMTAEEAREAEELYWKQTEQYNTAVQALEAQIPISDWHAIRRYMKPLESARDATPAIKGRRWHSLTKEVNDDQKGLFGMGKQR